MNTESIASNSTTVYKKNTESSTIIIILFLLAATLIIMVYNYWNIYTFVPRSFNQEEYTNQSDQLRPIVKNSLIRASQYVVGEMSPELQKHFINNINTDAGKIKLI